ncbi:hypothetical protein SAMN05216360_108140 [Methylobacterium phyllostachyos]|uniref:Uncharacterized protein n=1 Tax=Methylobacterium phyllostachyos TaxID=582672 RepID=A0A1H0BDU6_9HYPH|nr:hypothetical protein [Methylobacterium phyllostachyos]SDN43808.1 hypothetical protein SAMN05216360_108140 [Methylobacterium phyllostachyos]
MRPGRRDTAIIRSDDDRRPGEILRPEPFGWFAVPGFAHRAGEPLRLAATAPCCAVRDVAGGLLDQGVITWTEVFSGGTVAAPSAGPVVVFLHRLAPADVVGVGPALELPPLPTRAIVLHAAHSDPRGTGVDAPVFNPTQPPEGLPALFRSGRSSAVR